jgi:hypothetical protein
LSDPTTQELSLIEASSHRATFRLARSWKLNRLRRAARTARARRQYAPLPLVLAQYAGIDWSRALVNLAQALARAGAVAVRSSFEQPAPLEWAT